MNIHTEKAYTIFRNAVENKVYFKIGLSKKLQDGTFENGYVPIQFKKDVDLPNKTRIYLRQAWWTFYNKKVSVNGAEHKETVPYIFCNEFITVSDRIEETRPDFDAMEEKKKEKYNVADMISDEDLPFGD